MPLLVFTGSYATGSISTMSHSRQKRIELQEILTPRALLPPVKLVSSCLAIIRSCADGKTDCSDGSTELATRSPAMAYRPRRHDDLLKLIAEGPAEDSDEIVRRLRLHESPAAVLNAVKTGALAPRPLLLSEASRSTPGLEAEYSRSEQAFGLVKAPAGREDPSQQSDTTQQSDPSLSEPWTSVSADHEFIDHLIRLYFTWQHSFFQSFPIKLFRRDMQSGKTKYCSRFLFNAICAAGCLLSSRQEARIDPKDSRTAGMGFYTEALRLLHERNKSDIPTIAGLYLMCHTEGSRGHLSSLWMFAGQSARMSLDINLHLRSDRNPSDPVSPDTIEEEKARIHAFWGCFISDQCVKTPALRYRLQAADIPVGLLVSP